ncbi:MAG: murein transglycosylase, partial [Variovorax sp.]
MLALAIAGCTTTPRPSPPASPPVPTPTAPTVPVTPPPVASLPAPEPSFTLARWSELPGWGSDDAREALGAFRRGCVALASRAPWPPVCTAVAAVPAQATATAARAFFEQWLQPWRVTLREAAGTEIATGLVTGYYEPILRGSRTRTGAFTVPLYGVPDDLVTIDLGELYPALKGERVRGRLVGRKVVPYPDRAGISRGQGPKGRELLWVDSAIDAFFLQIQGSGRVRLPDGQVVRIAYADVNGHPYRAIGRVLVERGLLPLADATAPNIRAWLAAHPQQREEILEANPSVVFFREEPLPDPNVGPKGSLGVPLTAGVLGEHQSIEPAPVRVGDREVDRRTHRQLARIDR